jgi:hypothetical protein
MQYMPKKKYHIIGRIKLPSILKPNVKPEPGESWMITLLCTGKRQMRQLPGWNTGEYYG